MSKTLISCFFALILFTLVESNSEGDVLYFWKTQLIDPNNVLESWDPTAVNPCQWLHVTCNLQDRVARLDLGNASLTGTLVPQLASLDNLYYLGVFMNNLSGTIPTELGNLTNLIWIDLHQNKLSGAIPSSLGNLRSLRFMRVYDNRLSGRIPETVIQLIQKGVLEILDVSNNRFAGTTRRSNSRGYRTTTIIQDPKS